jgi:HEAT repeat protein
MFRTARRIAPLLGSLLLGATCTAGVVLTTGSIMGCADENAPETHVKKLSDPATRPGAVTRLIQFFEDAMTRDNKDRNGPTVKPLLDQIVEPMTQICVSGDLDERTQSKLVKFLSDARDPRGEPCLVKVLKDYKPDSTEEDVRWAVRAVGAMKLKSAAAPLIDVFKKMKASKPKADAIYRDVSDAMKEINDPSWESDLIGLLNRPIADPKDMATKKDELVWQITAAQILGMQKSEKAVLPLLKIVLSPLKADAALTAILGLVKIGKPSIQPTIALLNGENKDLVEYSKIETLKAQGGGDKPSAEAQKAAATAYISTAALVLATIGREESVPPMLAVLEKAEDVPRAIIAREIAKLPKSPDVVKAFQTAYEKTPITLSIPPGLGAKEALLEASGTFFDPSLTPWIVKTALDAKGEEGDLQPVREASLQAAIKLMTNDQVAEVDKLYNLKATGSDGKPSTLGKGFEKEYKLAKDMVAACGDKVDCYLGKLGEPASHAKETQFQGIKAAYMVGIYGTPDVRQKLLDMMPKITNAAVRFVSVTVIDNLSPKGDPAIADKLQAIVDEAEAKKDSEKMAGNAPFKTVIYRLQARAQ